MTVQSYIENTIQPKLQGDGGWCEYVSVVGDTLTLRFRGECSKCQILYRCTAWIEEQLETDLHKKLKVKAIRKRPYFQEV